MYILVCEDSMEGVFSGIYEAWAGKYPLDEVRLLVGQVGNFELFAEYRYIAKDAALAMKVANTIIKRFGDETYERICYALWSADEDKADVVFQLVRYGIEKKFGYELKDCLTESFAQRTFQLFRSSHNEAHRYLGFVRFEELESGILYASIKPKNHILIPVAVHFVERIPGENWIIHDVSHKRVVVHQRFGSWIVAEENMVTDFLGECRTESELEFQELWKSFCDTISIDARKNLKLQQQNLPLRFRETMIEL